MRDQYAGDISDFLKLALLRALVKENDKLGVAWFYNPANDGRRDGCRIEHWREPKWKALDSVLWNELRHLSQRSVEALEKLSIWPRETRFHRVAVPSTESRQSWALDMKAALDGSSVVFLDPDNGIGPTERHVTIQEVETMRQPGRALVLIKFPAWEDHDRQLAEYHASLLCQTNCQSLVTLRTMVWVNQPTCRWFTIIDADDALTTRAERFVCELDQIHRCSGTIAYSNRTELPAANGALLEGGLSSRQRSDGMLPSPDGRSSDRAQTVCPECEFRFNGRGYEGFDAHWRARHEAIMPYAQAWPLVKSGKYRRVEFASNPPTKS